LKAKDEEIHLKGAPVSEGIAIGVPVFLSCDEETSVPEFPITTGEVEGEIARYRRALSSSREDLKKLQANLVQEGSIEIVSIIDTHIQMLEDPMMTTHMEKKIREMLQNTESVFQAVVTDYQQRFSKTPDAFFQQRLADVKDLSQRVLRNLSSNSQKNLEEIPADSIIFAKELVPSDTASIQATRVSAFVTQTGGGTSHAALIARAKGIPYVASVDLDILQNARGKCVIVDGLTGDIIVNPSSDTLERYQELKQRLTKQYQQLEKDRHLPSETFDGFPVRILANINSFNDVDFVHHHSAAGIGLFRSEYLFLQSKTLYQEEDNQTEYYRQLLEKANGLPTVIRVFDIGGDKYPDLLGELKEPNPVLGCRGVRFLLKNKHIFKTQLRAIFRASLLGDVRILIPLISDINELRETKALIEEVKIELKAEGIPFKETIPLGCMVEVPSAVLICDILAQ
jgi:phosphotransferase system enzyme I (PtsI)